MELCAEFCLNCTAEFPRQTEKMTTFSTEPLDDRQLIAEIVQGDPDRFEELVLRHKDFVWKVAARHVPQQEVEELSQLAFIATYKSLGSFKGNSQFKTWLYRITVRTCYAYWRKKYRKQEVPRVPLGEEQRDWIDQVQDVQAVESFADECRKSDAREVVRWALNHLSAEDRMVLELVHLEGRSVNEVAAALGWSAANVKIRAFRSRKKLKQLIERNMP